MVAVSYSPSSTDPKHSMGSVLLAGTIGTVMEWYDFLIYATSAALVFNKLFFPSFDPMVGTLVALGSYAVGFFARPIGGALFGHFGDRVGRKSMLMATMMMMGFATCAIGLLPTYATIGIWAPILLVTLRVLQGIGLGGEWGGRLAHGCRACAGQSAGLLRKHRPGRVRARTCAVDPLPCRAWPSCRRTRSCPGAGACRSC